MDEMLGSVGSHTLRDGFAGQRMLVVPRPKVREACRQVAMSPLMVTDAGFFPHALRHGRSRPAGAEEHILLVCTDGSGWCRTSGMSFPVRPGDAVLLAARERHEYGASRDNPWTLWWFHMVGAYAGELVGAARAAAGGPVTHLRDATPVASLVSQIIDDLDTGTQAGLIRAAGAAWHSVTQVIATGRRPSGTALTPVDKAVEHLRATSPRRTSLTALAALVGLSTSQLGALFRQQLGVSPLQYQVQIRMAKARELLDNSDLPIAAIARACGYNDALYFTRQFTRTHGLAPSGYRSRIKGYMPDRRSVRAKRTCSPGACHGVQSPTKDSPVRVI